MEVKNLKTAVQQMYQICDQMEEKTNFRENMGLHEDATVTNILKMNLICFMAYLAASDGVVSWKECRFIGEIMDVRMTPAKLNEIIQDNNIYSTEFEEDPPMILRIFVAMDNTLYENGIDNSTELGDALFELYRFVTVGLIEANGRSSETMEEGEREDAQTYLGMMRNYIDDNTEKHHTDIILDYGKNHKRKKKDDDSGVKAPEKNQKAAGSVKAPKKKM